MKWKLRGEHRYTVRFDIREAYESGAPAHPQTEMRKLAEAMDFEINYSEPVSIADCRLFWLTSKNQHLVFPDYVTYVRDYYSHAHYLEGGKKISNKERKNLKPYVYDPKLYN